MSSPAQNEAGDQRRGLVLNLQRMSTEDGPGIRTTVFFKGCSLACTWCHNPESISPKSQVVWLEHKCIGCCLCLAACAHGALSKDQSAVQRDRSRCRSCGACVAECPGAAQQLLGESWSPEDLLAELLKDRAFFQKSGGGVTLSGGEPVLQASFVRVLMEGLRDQGVHVALDTCGQCREDDLLALSDLADMVLFDLKEMDPERHQRFTGRSNRTILANLNALGDHMARRSSPKEVWIRTPLIPGATASAENVLAIGRFIASQVKGLVSRWELLAFNNLCREQYQRLGLRWAFADSEVFSPEAWAGFEALALESGVSPELVHMDGRPAPTGEEIQS